MWTDVVKHGMCENFVFLTHSVNSNQICLKKSFLTESPEGEVLCTDLGLSIVTSANNMFLSLLTYKGRDFSLAFWKTHHVHQ